MADRAAHLHMIKPLPYRDGGILIFLVTGKFNILSMENINLLGMGEALYS